MARDAEKIVDDTNGIKEKIVVVTRDELIQSRLEQVNQKLDIIFSELTKNNEDKE